MNKLLRIVWYGLVVVATLLLLPILVIYAWSEVILRRHYDAEPQALAVAPAGLVAQGYRLARLHGCLSCHGEGLVGNEVFDAQVVGDMVAPNLTKLARRRTDAELTTAIRQ